MLKTITTCIYCGCGCGLHLDTKENNVVGAYPSQKHPISRGALCVKGWNAYEFINKASRLKTPLIKVKNGFKAISWEEALTIIANKFLAIKQRHGADAIGFLSSAKMTNEENYLAMKLARAVFKTNNIDHCARLCHASTVTGLMATFGSGAMTNSINEFNNAELFLVTGSNTTEQHPLIGSRIINAVHEKNAKLIIIDPRKMPLAEHAAMYLQPKSGTDVAWINGMMHIIIAENLHAKDYIAERTVGFDELKKTVKVYTPQHVEQITGIPQTQLAKAARLYAKTKKAMQVYAMGITQHITGVDNVMSLANLAMLTGHVGFESTGVNPLRGQNNVQGACDMGALPNVYSGYAPVTDGDARKRFAQSWGVTDLPTQNGLTHTEIHSAARQGKIKGLYCIGENSVLSSPDSNHVKACLSQTEFLVAQDMFLTETAQYADIVLPTASFAEKDGTFTNTERRVQRIRQVIRPPAEAKADWQILSELAKKCGYDNMNYTHPSQIMDEIASVTPIYAGIDYGRLDASFGIQWPCPNKNHPGTPILHQDKFTKGKGTFMPRHYLSPDELPDREYPFILNTGRTYWHWHTGVMTRCVSTLDREVPYAYAEMHPKDAMELNIKNGETVIISSRRGKIKIKIKVTDMVHQGSIFIPFHFKEAAANLLTNSALDKLAKIPEYKVCAVKVKKR